MGTLTRCLEDLAIDLRYAARTFRRNPAFSVTAMVCLALGIGANTTIFSVASEALFSPPSVSRPDTLMSLRLGGRSHVGLAQYRFVRNAGVFAGVAGENEETQANWRTGESTSRVFSVQITDNYFTVTGTPVAMGRPIQPGDADTTVLTWRFWQRRLAADPHVIGRKLVLDGRPFTVVGVLPRNHHTMRGAAFAPDIYVPISGESTVVSLYARLPQGMTKTVAFERLKAIAAEIDRQIPGAGWAMANRVDETYGLGRVSGQPGFMAVAAFFAMLMVVVTLVLLIACANVAGLVLARASSRVQELSIRLSIGAARGRLVRQILAETLLLAVAGAAAGLALNLLLLDLLARVSLPLPFPIAFEIRPDWRLLAYGALVSIVTTLAAGLLPALKITRASLASGLQSGARVAGDGRWSLRNTLVAGQLAASIVLLCTGFVFLRNLVEAAGMNPGFDLGHTVWASMRVVPEYYSQPKTAALVDRALDTLRATPGIDSATAVTVVPLNDGINIGSPIRTDTAAHNTVFFWSQNDVAPDYFRTMAIPILEGREFRRSDRDGSPLVAIVNRAFARRLFGEASPLGHTITVNDSKVEIVGVAADSHYETLGEENPNAMYMPYAQRDEQAHARAQRNAQLHFLIRTAGRPEAAVAGLRSALGALDPSAALEVRPMHSALAFALLPSQAGAMVLGSAGILGLVLASIGLYGVLLYSVSRRIREIGVRVALGAAPRDVLALVLRQTLLLVGAGMLTGLAVARLAVPLAADFLIPAVRPTDPLNFAVAAAVLGFVAIAASVAPAVRALRIDPLAALRHE
jgi:predicted permease